MAEFPLVKIEVFVPEAFVGSLGDALSAVGAGRVGNYEHCLSVSQVKGYWRPLAGAHPYQGEVGKLEQGEECKLEMVCRWELVSEAIRAIRAIHPYEEPVIQVIPLLNHLFEPARNPETSE